jgi:hypothetical protein
MTHANDIARQIADICQNTPSTDNDPTQAWGTLRSILLNFPDDLDTAECDEYDNADAFAQLLPLCRRAAETLKTGESWEIRGIRENLTEFALQLSLCPIHLIDYAICFDDNNDECAQVRMIHPSYDT